MNQHDPVTLEDSLREGLALQQAGDFQEALRRYEAVLNVEPDHPIALNLAGTVLGQLGRREEALGRLRQAVDIAPEYPDANQNLAVILRVMGRLEESLRAQRRVVALDPASAEAHNGLGILLRRLSRLNEAVESLHTAIDLDPGLADAHVNLGNVYQNQDKLALACAQYEAAIRIEPGRASSHRALGTARQRLHDLDAAIDSYRRALALDPEYAAACSDLGSALVERGEPAAAIEWLERANALAPASADVLSNLGMAHEACDNLEAALSAFDEALRLAPGSSHALAYRSIVLHALGRTDEERALVDLDSFIRVLEPVPPDGGDIGSLNEALAGYALGHPTLIDAAVRRSSQTCELFVDAEGPVVGFKEMIDAAVREYIAALPRTGTHPLLARRPERYHLIGWANVVESGEATTHIHPQAWISGVYYARTRDLPVDGDGGHPGWIEFGRPDEKHHRADDYTVRLIEPREGALVLFPSYLWHRILPFQSTSPRISYAFDVVPM